MKNFTQSWQTNWTKKLNRYVPALAVVVVFGGLGTALLFTSHAATPTAFLEAENGTVSSAASAVTDTTASNGQAVKFGQSSGGAGSKPNATNTGVPAGTTLTAYTGPDTITTNGTAIDGKLISGTLFIDANNVTIRNSKIVAPGGAAGSIDAVLTIAEDWNSDKGVAATGTLISHVEIAGGDRSSCNRTIGGINYTADAVNVHGCIDGIWTAGNTVIKNSYVHGNSGLSGDHMDCFQLYTGTTGGHDVTLNNINCDGSTENSGAGFDKTFQTDGPIYNFLIENSWLAGGSQYLNISCSTDPGSCTTPVPYLTVINNHVYPSSPGSNSGPTFFNAYAGDSNNISCSSNTWADTGALLFGTGKCT